jgi:hypothetical protein
MSALTGTLDDMAVWSKYFLPGTYRAAAAGVGLGLLREDASQVMQPWSSAFAALLQHVVLITALLRCSGPGAVCL